MLSANLAFLGRHLTEETDTSDIGPGIVAFGIVVLLGVATFFLIRSMLHHMGKVPPTFENQDDETGEQNDADPIEQPGDDSPSSGSE